MNGSRAAAYLALLLGLASAKIHVDQATSTFRDDQNRTLIFHGLNFLPKSPPYYPTITEDNIAKMQSMGMSIVRLGVMMSGVFPSNKTPSTAYLDEVAAIVQQLHTAGFYTILDLHQDVLSPKVCGEGLPDWMVNVSTLGAHDFPFPLKLTGNIPPDPVSGSYANKSCSAVGPAKFIGWSEFYGTDACGKAFQQIYDGKGLMAEMVELYWDTVSRRFNGTEGVLFYEIMNEPWVGDAIAHPSLIAEGGKAEQGALGSFMQRMHAVIRTNDRDTMVLFSPAEVNNRLMRKVGYQEGFLPGEPMTFHTYCVTGTDGAGPTTPTTIALCHLNDGFQIKQRESDLRRLKTAGIVTEFGAVSGVTGLAEVTFVADHFDSANPPLSWAFCGDRALDDPMFTKGLSRPYPRAVAGELLGFAFNSTSADFTLSFKSSSVVSNELRTDVFLGVLQYPDGRDVSLTPSDCCTVTDTLDGISIVANKVDIQIEVKVVAQTH